MTDTALAIVSTWIVVINTLVCGALIVMAVCGFFWALGWLWNAFWHGVDELGSFLAWIYDQRQ